MEKKEKVVYIVGAISLDRDYFRKFKEAEKKLREEGYERIINPICLPDNLPYRRYAPISIAFVEASDVVFVLSNYNNSVGAQAEIAYAKMAGKEITFERTQTFTEADSSKVRAMYSNASISMRELIKAEEDGTIVKIAEAGDYKKAYEDFLLDEETYDGTRMTYDEFMTEFRKGYGKSGCVQIARLFELSNGVWYDNEYVG
jgi:hypothetical protein